MELRPSGQANSWYLIRQDKLNDRKTLGVCREKATHHRESGHFYKRSKNQSGFIFKATCRLESFCLEAWTRRRLQIWHRDSPASRFILLHWPSRKRNIT